LTTAAVLGNLKRTIKKQVTLSYPQTSEQDKQAIVEQKFREIVKMNKRKINKTVKENYKILMRSGKDRLNRLYLIAADSYYYLGLTKNILKTGKVSDSLKNGLYYNALMVAPHGHYYYFDLHPYAGFFVYSIMHLFNGSISLEAGVAATPLILTFIAILIFLILAYIEDVHPLPLFTGLLSFVFAPIFFQRSLYGWYDTDPYNAIFPLLIILFLFRLFPVKSITFKHRITSVVSLSVITGIYTMFWSGWVYAIVCTYIFFILVIVYSLAVKNKHILKEISLLFIVYIISSGICIMMFKGPGGLVFSVKDTLGRLAGFIRHDFNLWPDAFLTVGELKKVSLAKIAVLSGGRIFSIIALSGLVTFFIRRSDRGNMVARGLILLPFISIPFFMSIHAERFTILLVAPLAISFTLFLNYAFRIRVKGIVIQWISYGLLSLLIVMPLVSAKMIASRNQPIIFNETWEKVLIYARDNTPKDSIINTWWAPGHFITSIARRRVTFDGATLENPVGYWISRFFLSQNEEEAIGILRMLNTSDNEAALFLQHDGIPLSKAIEIINRIILLTPQQSMILVSPILDKESARTVTRLTHGTPPPSYVLIYKDLVQKSLALQFMGNWDFRKAESFKKLKSTKPGLARKIIKEKADNNYIRLFWGISGGPIYNDEASPEIKRSGSMIYFKNGITVNIDTKDIGFSSPDKKFKDQIESIVYLEDGSSVAEMPVTASGKLSVMLLDNGGKYAVVVADKRLVRSILFRLYYFKGIGLDHFKLAIHDNSSQDDSDIYLYEVVW